MISGTNTKVQYSPSAPTNQYPFSVRYFDSEDINVEVVNNLGVTTVLTLDAVTNGFSVTAVNGNPENGATIDTTTAYGSGNTITIYRFTPKTQEASFQRGGDLSAVVLNTVLDRGVAISQELGEAGEKHITCPITDPDGLHYELPTVALRKNKAVGFDANGNAVALDLATTGTISVDTSTGLVINNNIISCRVDDETLHFSNQEFAVKAVSGALILDNTIASQKLINESVTTDKLATGSVIFSKINSADITTDLSTASTSTIPTSTAVKDYVDTRVSGSVVQTKYTIKQSMTYYSGLTAIPTDATAPTSSEGAEILTVSITPTSATSIFKIEGIVHMENGGGHKVISLFIDGETTPVATSSDYGVDNAITSLSLLYYMTAGSGAKVFRLRAGSDITDLTINGINNTVRYGSTLSTILSVTELRA